MTLLIHLDCWYVIFKLQKPFLNFKFGLLVRVSSGPPTQGKALHLS